MSDHGKHDHCHVNSWALSRRARLQALLFTAGSIATTLLTLGMLADSKLPRYQTE
jgi:hypothetical protein